MTVKSNAMNKKGARNSALNASVAKKAVTLQSLQLSKNILREPMNESPVQTRNRISADLLDTARDLAVLGILTKPALARVKALILEVPPTFSPEHVVAIRTKKARMSQAVFARILNVSISTVQKWEAPAANKHPSGAAAKLLQVIEKNGIEAVI